jgi:hypothetical protein
VGAGLFLAGLVATYVFLDRLQDRELQEAIAEADRTDPDWRLLDLDAKRDVLTDEENACFQMVKVKQSGVARWPIWDFPPAANDPEGAPADREAFSKGLGELKPPVLLNVEQERVLRNELKRNENAVAEARKMVDFPRGRNPIVWSKDYVSTLLPYTQDARHIAYVLDFDILLRCQDGDLEGALTSCHAIFNANRALGDEPTFISMLVRIAIRAITLRKLERVLAQGELPEAALARMQRLLEEDEPVPVFLIGARGERGMMDGFLEAVQRGDVKVTDVRKAMMMASGPTAGGTSLGDNLQYLMLLGSVKHQRAAMLNRMNRVVEVARLPVEQQGPELEALQDSFHDGPLVVRRLAPAVLKVSGACRRSHAEMRCFIALLAAERYRLANGRWPESLDDLVPAYLERVPVDPFDAGPIKYKQLPDGVAVYSASHDGTDDGGNLSNKFLDKGTDWGFRLWDVKSRRQSPK